MNLYAHDLSLSLFDLTNFSDDPIIDLQSSFGSLIRTHSDSNGGDKRSKSPPKHRHDRTSPLPLGMDWSLPPRRWDGRDTVWPHDPQTGWSYCVRIPSWILLPTSRGSDSVVFYKVKVGIQSPEGVTTTRGILRRFSDFLNLLSELKKIFPNKNLPPAPPKRILRVKNRTLFEERRCYLEDWMEKLLSDIDISRSVSVATFLELEAAARASFDNGQSDAVSSVSRVVPSVLSKANLDIDNASDLDNTSSEISDLGTPRRGKDNSAGPSMEHSTLEPNLIEPLDKSTKYGISNRNFILENLEKFSKQKKLSGGESDAPRDKITENSTDSRYLHGDGAEHFPELEHCKMDGHVQRFSTESLGSDLSSVRASDISNLGITSLFGDGLHDFPENADACRTLDTLTSDLQCHRDFLILFLSDERRKLKKDLNTLQRRLATAKTDVEDLISRFNQESAVRQFLATKVKDLEVELETTRENCYENMQQAILLERERFTQMQWDTELVRKQCLEMELKLKNEQDERAHVESEKLSLMKERKILLQELDVARKQLADLKKQNEELEVKSKARFEIEQFIRANYFEHGQAQLLAQDVENSAARPDESHKMKDGDKRIDYELRKMLTDMFVDNARLRKQVNSVVRCALDTYVKTDDGDEEDISLRKTVLSKFL
ncbi:hypothetical protein like AT3G15920 [Hibiscus trionum]|uniref:PX domain-containing protein n=1 Tax=Hibiscus trionum TaxID=183268 RepID=A0A9W7HIM9_HIBTR|nr:hypothetical protein like AT3G15920 [Hibiscus trionum]